MSNGQLETVKLTARFKLDGEVDESLFKTYKAVVNELLDYAHSKGITSFERLKSEKYHEMRRKYPELPSHYIYTACQLARSIYKSFRKLKRRGKGEPLLPHGRGFSDRAFIASGDSARNPFTETAVRGVPTKNSQPKAYIQFAGFIPPFRKGTSRPHRLKRIDLC